MNLGTLRKRKWKVTLGGALTVLLATAPVLWLGSVCVGSLPGGADSKSFPETNWRELFAAMWPGLGALLAGALLLLPFGLSTLRLRRRG